MEEWTRERLYGAALHYTLACFAAESPPRAKELAGIFGLSGAALTRLFLRYLGVSPSEFFLELQCTYACLLLARKSLTTTQVAYRAGFGSRTNLFRVFRRRYDDTPRGVLRTSTGPCLGANQDPYDVTR